MVRSSAFRGVLVPLPATSSIAVVGPRRVPPRRAVVAHQPAMANQLLEEGQAIGGGQAEGAPLRFGRAKHLP